MMSLPFGYKVIRFSDQESGLYVHNFRNDFGTPLAARGTVEELDEFVRVLKGQ